MANARKILIVDDDTDLRDTLVEQLSLHDEFEASAVDTGAKGATAAKTDAPDLVLMDVGLPDTDGREVVRSLRKVRERYEGKTISTRELLDVFAEDLPPSLRYEGKRSLDWFLDGWVNGTSLPKLELQGVKFTAKADATVVSGVIRQKDAPEDLVTSVPIYAIVSGKAPVLVGRVFADGAESSFRLSAPVGTHKLLLDPNETILTSPK